MKTTNKLKSTTIKTNQIHKKEKEIKLNNVKVITSSRLLTLFKIIIPLPLLFPKFYTTSPLILNYLLSLLLYIIMVQLIPKVSNSFIKAHLKGVDVLKLDKPVLPESLGLLGGAFYILGISIFIPLSFGPHFNWFERKETNDLNKETFPHLELHMFLAGLLSILSMILLGFTDDVFDLRWRHKFFLPSIAAIPMLMIYYIGNGVTYVIIPYPLDQLINKVFNLGIFYYIYMAMITIFCTNAINILAGINGIEVLQSIIISCSIILFNLVHINSSYPNTQAKHLFSLYMMFPFLFISLALYKFNRFPARIFLGDTYCYFSGMVFAVVGILAHFTKTLLLFFLPQIFNFLVSLPQLFHLVPCPRHRMPCLNDETGQLEPSYTEVENIQLTKFQIYLILFFERIKLTQVLKNEKHQIVKFSNWTILNMILVLFGPLKEDQLAIKMAQFQVLCCGLAFLLRLTFVPLFYYHN